MATRHFRIALLLLPIVLYVSCEKETLSSFDDIAMERTACYGVCPIYRLHISGDGRVTYDGVKYVKVKGRQNRQLTRDQVNQLTTELNKVQYFRLRSSYRSSEDGCPASWTDNPSTITRVTADGKTKSVDHYYGCRYRENNGPGTAYPEKLTRFERRVDEIVRSSEWIGAIGRLE